MTAKEQPLRKLSPQEHFWQGEFGNEYTQRNKIVPSDRVPFFTQVLSKTSGVASVLEIGCNSGHNLEALQQASSVPLELTGIDVNSDAISELLRKGGARGVVSSIQDFEPSRTYDLVFTCGVLIHVCPEDLVKTYQKMFDLSARYLLINEYFNPKPVQLEYRGHSDRLFKRDFAGECIDANDGQLAVVDCGFLYNRCNKSWDNTTWFLLEKLDR